MKSVCEKRQKTVCGMALFNTRIDAAKGQKEKQKFSQKLIGRKKRKGKEDTA